MSYLVLARKWRPQGLDDLIGQEPIIKVLQNSISQNKIAHAYIFSGPRGVGKTSTARILAKALNCEKGPTPVPCGICPSCTSVKDGTSIDVLEIDGASNTGVDNIRDLREGVKYTPLSSRYKIYIIDEAHMLSTSAFNALLKTLEEPPPHAIFVLATTAPQKIPGTIFSRCQHLPFRRISAHRIKGRLKHITESEGIKISDSAIEMISRAADGSMRDSLTILDQISSFSSEIKESDVKDMLGMADTEMLARISIAVIEGDREGIIKLIAELVEKGTDIRTFAKDLIGFFRDLLVAKIVRKPEDILELSENEADEIKKILPKVSPELLTLMLSEIIKAETDIRSAFSPRLSLEMSLIRASFLSTLTPVKEAIEHIDAIIKGLPPSEARSQSSSEARSLQSPRATRQGEQIRSSTDQSEKPGNRNQSISETYQDKDSESGIRNPEADEKLSTSDSGTSTALDGNSLLTAVIEKIEDPRISSKLAAANPTLKDDALILTFNSNEALIFADSIRKNTSLLETIASDIRKHPTKIEINTKSKTVVRKKDLQDKALAEPAIKEVIELFDGRIIDVKLKENKGG
ncbi:MAG: DNA polymerase III subunit gamma/tau [Nitrospirae bacterium]|nr:DNA polymerase III subunit gamma/tau [Nitrospirota bacterium]